MPNAQAIGSLFNSELLSAVHSFASDTFKAALYKTTANVGLASTQYTASGEVSGLNYVPGGIIVPSAVPPKVSGRVTYWTPSSDLVFPSVTIGDLFNAVMLYNASRNNKTLGVWVFPQRTLSAATFTLKVPVNSSSTALLRWKTH